MGESIQPIQMVGDGQFHSPVCFVHTDEIDNVSLFNSHRHLSST